MSTDIDIETRKNPVHEEPERTRVATFPSTRYQGCKRQIIEPLWDQISNLDPDSVLDLFGGTGVLSYKAKAEGKQVHYNDVLSFNQRVGTALIRNNEAKLSYREIEELLTFDLDSYPSLIQDEFQGLYFTDDENAWLDRMRKNIVVKLDDPYKKAIAIAAVGQACLTKRPYALFHRANLYMRTQDVERSFGNKTTWERPFEHYFRKFAVEYNRAVFTNGREHTTACEDAVEWDGPDADIVYLDPPYYAKGKSNPMSDYHLYYHFLEGYVDYGEWPARIDDSVKTKKIEYDRAPWNKPESIAEAFRTIFSQYEDSDLVLSYNTQSLPTPDTIADLMAEYKNKVRRVNIDHSYSLNSDDGVQELLFIGSN